MIPFWNPWDLANAQEVHLDILVTMRIIRKLRNVLQLGFWLILGVLMGCDPFLGREPIGLPAHHRC